MKKLLLINGPNLNLLGIREPDKYGTTTLAEIETDLRAFVESTGGTLTTYQSNHEGDLVDRIQQAAKEVAISTAMLDKGIEDVSKFKIKSIELVYSTRAVQFEADEPSMNPCWKINYSYPEMAEDDEGSIWIDAVTGFVSKYIENL